MPYGALKPDEIGYFFHFSYKARSCLGRLRTLSHTGTARFVFWKASASCGKCGTRRVGKAIWCATKTDLLGKATWIDPNLIQWNKSPWLIEPPGGRNGSFPFQVWNKKLISRFILPRFMPVNRAFTKPDGLPQPGEMFALKFKAQLPLEEEFLKEIGNPLVLRPEDWESWRDDLGMRLDRLRVCFFQNDIFSKWKIARSRRTFFWIMTLGSPRFLVQLSWHISRDFVLGRMKWFWWCWALNQQPVPSKVMPRRVWNCLRSLERGLKMLECFAVSLFLM